MGWLLAVIILIAVAAIVAGSLGYGETAAALWNVFWWIIIIVVIIIVIIVAAVVVAAALS